MNCAEPANTASDINWPCQRWSGPEVTSVPKITPKGAAPIIIGMVSRAPATNSWEWLGWVNLSSPLNKERSHLPPSGLVRSCGSLLFSVGGAQARFESNLMQPPQVNPGQPRLSLRPMPLASALAARRTYGGNAA